MNPLPTHIAIIMDGNGRWALDRGLSRVEGHKKGVETVEEITIACREIGVKYLTLYAFSDENWERPVEEVKGLMNLLVEFLRIKRQKLIDNDVRFMTIGDNERLPEYVKKAIKETEEATRICNKMTLILAISYGSKNEICRAVKKLLKAGETEITPEAIEQRLDTAGLPDPDLFIRTSGELRVSNFLLWQIAYSEFYFPKKLWPDFTRLDLEIAIKDYQNRERRFGKINVHGEPVEP